MKVIDNEKGAWYLFQDGDHFYLDGNYSHRAIEYDNMIELSQEEKFSFRSNGRGYINQLYQEIQESAPILKISDSPYKERRIVGEVRERTTKAVKEWNDAKPKGQLDLGSQNSF